ncbi:MAG: hypothetical protein FWC70_09080 [Defluviitaleaceae bacterium]|nr:hypothetical protein [Defluviitaleaceae bacterium]
MKKIFCAAILTVMLAFAGFAACTPAERPLTAVELLNLGERFLLDLNFEQALIQFTRLIEI